MRQAYELIGIGAESAEHSEEPTVHTPSWRQIHTSGWRFGIISCAVSTSCVFLVNFTILIWSVSTYGVGEGGRQVLYDGNCETVRKLNLVIHLFINCFSTVLLSCSNYCMQCLSAATRSDIDKVHQRSNGGWLDIGVPSIRNLREIDRKRALLWLLLGTSSLPLHLLFNSAVFSSIASYSYPIIVTDERFLTGRINSTDVGKQLHPTLWEFYNENLTDVSYSDQYLYSDYQVNSSYHNSSSYEADARYMASSASRLTQKASSGLLQRLDVQSCISAYAQDFVTSRGALVLVLDLPDSLLGNSNSNASILKMTPNWSPLTDVFNSDVVMQWCEWDTYAWICMQDHQDGCKAYSSVADPPCRARIPSTRSNSSGWRPLEQEHPVKYCLSETLPERCKLQASFHIALIVVLLNAVKALIMFVTVFKMAESPLLTIGDAVASFLENPDPYTHDMCLLSQNQVRHTIGPLHRYQPFYTHPRRHFEAVSKKRWAACNTMLLVAIIVCGSLFDHAKRRLKELGVPEDLKALWELGFGSINALTIIAWRVPAEGTTGLISNVLVANTPQIILSLVYFTYNGVFTCMWMAAEWNLFSQHRKGLRMSQRPTGAQRSTYFLQLPYRVAVPLMVISGVLHWLVSQSIFLVNIEGYWWDNDTGGYSHEVGKWDYLESSLVDRISCGFSPMPILFVILIGIGMMVLAIAIGARPFKSNIPLARSCSLVISACCHPEASELKEGNIALKRVKWGVTGVNADGIGHCSFSSREVWKPEEGVSYM